MKIGILLENPIRVGGGFNQALNAVRQFNRICSGRHVVVVYTTIAANVEPMRRLQIDVQCLAPTGIGHWVSRIVRAVSRGIGLNETMRAHESRRVERALLTEGVDLAYFVTHSSTPSYFRQLSYMTTVLDLCHRDNLEFPEVSINGQFSERERHFMTCLPRAFVIMVASKGLAKSISARYGIDDDRMIAMPFEPSPYLAEAHAQSTEVVLDKHGLKSGYYFYPAQFWPHKNHVRLIEALALLRRRMGPKADLRLVFSGDDQGNVGWVKRKAAQLGVGDCVFFLGFVPAEDVRALYVSSLAVVMPSYFGPTNMPPLEAWALGRPLIYSAHLFEQIGAAALMADADDANAWAEAMFRIRDPEVSAELAQRGMNQLKLVEAERFLAEVEVGRRLEIFALRRQCWE